MQTQKPNYIHQAFSNAHAHGRNENPMRRSLAERLGLEVKHRSQGPEAARINVRAQLHEFSRIVQGLHQVVVSMAEGVLPFDRDDACDVLVQLTIMSNAITQAAAAAPTWDDAETTALVIEYRDTVHKDAQNALSLAMPYILLHDQLQREPATFAAQGEAESASHYFSTPGA